MEISNTPFDAMDSMFEQMFRSMAGDWHGSDANLRVDRIDEGFVLTADLPGFEKDDIDVRFADGRLTIVAASETDGSGGEMTSETTGLRRTRNVRESLVLPSDIAVEEIGATYRNGVLEITLPLEGSADETRIDVQ